MLCIYEFAFYTLGFTTIHVNKNRNEKNIFLKNNGIDDLDLFFISNKKEYDKIKLKYYNN